MTSDAIATGKKRRYRFATGGKLILIKHILLSSILVNNTVIVIENKQKNFQLQLSTCENFQLQLLLQQNCTINYNFVNYNNNFSKPAQHQYSQLQLHQLSMPKLPICLCYYFGF